MQVQTVAFITILVSGLIFTQPDSYSQNTAKKTTLSTSTTKPKPTRVIKPALPDRNKSIVNDSVSVIHAQVDIPAKFPGGDSEWRKYLERNFNRDLAFEKGAPPGNYTVVVSFIVGTDGVLSDVKAENDPGYGAAEQAVRLIKNGPKWIPAVKNGKSVAYRQRQGFMVCTSEE